MSTTARANGSWSIKRQRRRTQADMYAIRQAIRETLSQGHPMTVRGLFYQLVGLGVIPKTEAEYKGTVVRLATEMRIEGDLPFKWIADNTRWRHGGGGFVSMDEWLEESLRTYRLDLWRDQDAYVEVWLEKDALTGVLLAVTDPLCVPLMVTRGYPSLTYLANAAANIASIDKPTFIYYLGDHDPSGVNIPIVVERRLRELSKGVRISFERIGVTREQIDSLRLPTRPTKKSDSRSKGFEGESVEVDALPADFLRALVREKIMQHVDADQWRKIKLEERLGRETLKSIHLPERREP